MVSPHTSDARANERLGGEYQSAGGIKKAKPRRLGMNDDRYSIDTQTERIKAHKYYCSEIVAVASVQKEEKK